MLLTFAPIHSKQFTGMAAISLGSWQGNAHHYSESILKSIQANITKIEDDPKATKFYLEKLGSPELSDLHSSVSQAFKQEARKTNLLKPTIGMIVRLNGKKNPTIALQTSPLFRTHLLSEEGELLQLGALPKTEENWHLIDLKEAGKSKNISSLVISFLGADPSLNNIVPLKKFRKIHHRRIADWAQRPEKMTPIPCLQAPLNK